MQRSASVQVGAGCTNNMHATPITTDQLRISTGADGVHDAAIIATCPALTQVVIAASCTPTAPVLILSWVMVVVVVEVACCCCIPLWLALMLVLAFAHCACSGSHQQQLTVVVLLPQPLAQILHLHTWLFHSLQLAPVVFFLPHWHTQMPNLCLGNLRCVVCIVYILSYLS